MPRFFIENLVPDDLEQIEIGGNDARHIRDVLRMQPGETVTVCDGARVDFCCSIETYRGDQVVLHITHRSLNGTEASFDATLYQGLPKGDKFDLIIQKCVELGIGRIVPVACERSIVKIAAADAPKKVQRWTRIAQEAAKQCGRGRIPEVTMPLRFAEAIAQVGAGYTTLPAPGMISGMPEQPAGIIAFIPYEGEREISLRGFLESVLPRHALVHDRKKPDAVGFSGDPVSTAGRVGRPSIAFFIGPEGGFSPDEIAAAMAAGIQTVSLGRRILRTETASLAVLVMLGYHFADF